MEEYGIAAAAAAVRVRVRGRKEGNRTAASTFWRCDVFKGKTGGAQRTPKLSFAQMKFNLGSLVSN